METKSAIFAFNTSEVQPENYYTELEPINLTKVDRRHDSEDETGTNPAYVQINHEYRRFDECSNLNLYNRPEGRRQMMPENRYSPINTMMDFPDSDIDEATLKNIKNTSQYLLDAPASHYGPASPKSRYDSIANNSKDYPMNSTYGSCYGMRIPFQCENSSPTDDNTVDSDHAVDINDNTGVTNDNFTGINVNLVNVEEISIGDKNAINRNIVMARFNRNRVEYDSKWQLPNSNQDDIMRAAKALFSKKTRTLYHWMYPTSPKFQLKTAVSMAWDAMPLLEKQFYVSQVLEKNGCSQNRLMINPQLGYVPTPKMRTTIAQVHDYHCASTAETDAAVNNLILSDTSSHGRRMPIIKKRGRPRGATSSTTMKMVRVMQRLNRDERRRKELKFQPLQPIRQELIRKQYELVEQQQIQLQQKIKTTHIAEVPFPEGTTGIIVDDGGVSRGVEPNGDEFNDDPELRKEFEMYQLSMTMNN